MILERRLFPSSIRNHLTRHAVRAFAQSQLVVRAAGSVVNFSRHPWRPLLYCPRRSAGRVRSLFFGFNHSGEHRGIVKSKFILALGGQWSPFVLDATAAEAQLTNSWISNLGGFCTCPFVNESN
jgi:hypothetical protein